MEKPAQAEYGRDVEISPQNRSVTNGGHFQGWGTSLCWWANRLGHSDKLAQLAAELFFGEEGLRLNIMRYNIGGGDDPAHCHITRTDSAVPGWAVYDSETGGWHYDEHADWRQLGVLRRAAAAAGERAWVELFSNSPPFFMTESGCSSGNADAGKNNLKPEYTAAFADYLAHAAKYIQEQINIRVCSVSPMNEPNTRYWRAYSEKQEGCHFDAGKAQSELLAETARAFAACGLKEAEIAGSDETNPRLQLIACNAYSEQARAVLSRINTHSYQESGIRELGAFAKREGINLWMSEVDGAGTAGENAGEMAAALWLGKKIVSDMNALSPSAWVLWQVIDNHISREGLNGNADSGMVDRNAGYWGTAVADHDAGKILLTQKYYGFGQFTRYIRPDDTILHCGEDALASYDGKTNRLKVVAVNPYAADRPCRFILSGMKNGGKTVQAVRTSGSLEGGESWAQLAALCAREDGFTAELRGNSITTFILEPVLLEDGALLKNP